jgi:hypothetical protein
VRSDLVHGEIGDLVMEERAEWSHVFEDEDDFGHEA